jgi:CMP-N-acetylneuraminic acid synthetase
MRRIAIIPARGGSKRLARKNVADFMGRPILTYTIEAARRCALFDRVVVSTEDPEIAAIAAGWSAEVDERPFELATGEATVADVCIELLEREAAGGRDYDVVSVLYATAPLRTADDITAVVSLIEPGRCDFAIAVTEFDLPVHQALRPGDGGSLSPVFPDLVQGRADAAGPIWVDNGSTYAASVPAYREARTFYRPGLRGHFMPRSRSVDVDTADDLAMARHFAARLGI